MASLLELTCIYSALILHEDEVTVVKNKINTLIKAAGGNAEPFRPALFVTALANVNTGSRICNIGAGRLAPTAGASPAGVLSLHCCCPTWGEGKKEESEEFNDGMGIGLFD